MLRKDVKLGFAIGGVMLAVLVAYVLVVPGTDHKGGVQIIGDDQSQQSKTGDKPTPDNVVPMPVPDNKSADLPVVDNKSPANDPNAKPDVTPAPAPSPALAHNSGTDIWETSLTTGKLPPTMISQTPTADEKASHPADISAAQPSPANTPANPAANTTTNGDMVATPPVADKTTADNTPAKAPDPAPADKSAATPAAGSTDAAANPRTHVVQQGEMLTSIAAAVYGDSKQWKRIAAANPNVNPNRLKLGTTLVIPDAAAAAPAPAAGATSDATARTASARSAPSVDPRTQYQVQENDSLYRISMKLYGKSDQVDKIYEANKDTIGPDRARLKLHMILALPTPPTNTLASSAAH